MMVSMTNTNGLLRQYFPKGTRRVGILAGHGTRRHLRSDVEKVVGFRGMSLGHDRVKREIDAETTRAQRGCVETPHDAASPFAESRLEKPLRLGSSRACSSPGR